MRAAAGVADSKDTVATLLAGREVDKLTDAEAMTTMRAAALVVGQKRTARTAAAADAGANAADAVAHLRGDGHWTPEASNEFARKHYGAAAGL